MLQQQQERAEDRKDRADDRHQMMALMMAMISGRQPPPPIRVGNSDDSDLSGLELDNILVPKAPAPKDFPKRAPPTALGVVTRQYHKKKRGLEDKPHPVFRSGPM